MINKDNTIAEILDKKSSSEQIFKSYGMGCLGCPSSTMETLEQACYIHGIDLDEILKKLNEK